METDIPNVITNPVHYLLYSARKAGLDFKRYSVRVNKSIGGAKVAIINKTIDELYDYNEILREEFFYKFNGLMIGEGRPIASISGCIMIEDDEFLLEAARDIPVRSLTHCKICPSITIRDHFSSDRWRFYSESLVVGVIDEARKLPQSPAILEFSIFPFGTGPKKENILFWEYERINSWT